MFCIPKEHRPRLGRTAIAAYEAMQICLPCRHVNKPAVGPLHLSDMKKVMGEVDENAATSMRSVKRALLRLRDAGLVQREVRREAWWKDGPRWRTLLTVTNFGQYRAIHSAWQEWNKGHVKWGGDRTESAEELQRTKVQDGPYIRDERDATLGRKTTRTKVQDGPSLVFSILTPESSIVALPRELDELDTLEEQPKLQEFLRTKEYPVKPRREPLYTGIKRGLPNDAIAQFLAGSYREAVQTHYNRRSYVLWRGEISKSRAYKTLLAGAALLEEEAVSPLVWADWMVGKYKEWGEYSGKSWGKKPPPIVSVFSPKVIAKRLEHFRNSYDGPTGWRAIISDKDIDLHYRTIEASRIARGFSADSALHGLPKLYAARRMAERFSGRPDPFEGEHENYMPRIDR